MTHDELLDRIAQEGLKPDGNVLNTRLILALRAVVELHKPVEMPYARVEGTLTCNYCSGLCHSRSGLSCEDCPPLYPCPTIQAIEEQLK